MIGDQVQIKSKSACLVIADKSLAERLMSGLEAMTVDTVATLSDLKDDSRYEILVIDTAIPDIGKLPLVRLKRTQKDTQVWVFLVNLVEDVTDYLNPLPERSLVFQHGTGTVDAVNSLLSKLLDFQADKKIDAVDVIPDINALSVRMFNGNFYLLLAADIDDDGSRIECVHIADDRFHLTVLKESGNQIEIPWDAILYHCEPDYEHYKGRASEEMEEDRAVRIGLKVKDIRTAKGLSISQLAEIAGMQRSNLSRLEHGKHLPSLETLDRIADGLEIQVVELLAKNSTRFSE